MKVHKITPSEDYYQWLKRLDTHLTKTTNQNLTKVPKFAMPTNKKTLL